MTTPRQPLSSPSCRTGDHAIRDRREFLGALAGALASPCLVPRSSLDDPPRIVLIILGGGVRPQDVAGPAGVMPRLAALADEGTVARRARAAAATPLLAQRAILSGSTEGVDEPIGADPRGLLPTVFEYLHHGGGLPADDLWFVASGTGTATRLASSRDPDLGTPGVAIAFAADRLLERDALGGLRSLRSAATAATEDDLTPALDALFGDASSPRAKTLLALESFVASEGRLAEESGPGMGDARALRAAIHAWVRVRPRLMVVLLQDAAIAARSADDYRAVLGRVDAGIGAFVDAVAGVQDLLASTSFVFVTDHGRAQQPNAAGALPADPMDRAVLGGFVCAAGPAFKRKEALPPGVQAIDVIPTICHLFGVRTRKAQGRVLRRALS